MRIKLLKPWSDYGVGAELDLPEDIAQRMCDPKEGIARAVKHADQNAGQAGYDEGAPKGKPKAAKGPAPKAKGAPKKE